MKRLLQRLVLMAFVVIVGTFIDHYVHALRPHWYVEAGYFRNKILFGVLWGLAGWYALRRVLAVTKSWQMALGVPAVIALILQTKYFYQGYDLGFVVGFLFLHYLMFLPSALVVFRFGRDAFLSPLPVGAHPRWGLFVALVAATEAVFFAYFRFLTSLY